MLKKLKKNLSVIMFTIVSIVCIFLIVFILTVVNEYSGTIVDKITDKATVFSLKTDEFVGTPISTYISTTSKAAGLLQDHNTQSEFNTAIANLKNLYTDVKDIAFIKDGIYYTKELEPVENSAKYKNLIDEASTGVAGCYGIIYNSDYNMNLMAFYAPISGNDYADAIILLYNETIIKVENILEEFPDITSSEFSVVCTANGRVIMNLYPEDGVGDTIVNVQRNYDIIEEIYEKISISVSSELTSMITGDEDSTTSFTYNGERYAFSVKHNSFCSDLVSVSLYRANKLDGEQDTVIASIGSILIIFCIALPIVLLIVFLASKYKDYQIKIGKSRDDDLHCLTIFGMHDEITDCLKKFPGTKYAVVAARLKHYRYLADTFPTKVNPIIHGMRNFFHSSLELGECLSTGSQEGEFILFLHFRTMEQLTKRLWSIANLISDKVGFAQFQVRLDIGIYEVIDTKVNPKDMVNNAVKVIDSDSSKSGLTNITVFSDVYHENYMKAAEVEVKMDMALENDEFKVFFQPKLNIVKNTIDGCEALVRWYDEEKGEYIKPGIFLPIFEQNGFISKLDKYVFMKACEFIGLRLSQHLPVFPTSVNISKYTALEAGFMEYYASIKNKYGIPDNFITLELSESVAANSFKELNQIATSIHNNKFLVSIDDYGSGYSSFNVLKSIKTDEIKIDSMFLEKGISAESDHIILSNIIKLANELGIKTVQEGVETKEQLEYVQQAGCKVVQGYWLSKPLSMLDYIKFIDARTLDDERRAREKNILSSDD